MTPFQNSPPRFDWTHDQALVRERASAHWGPAEAHWTAVAAAAAAAAGCVPVRPGVVLGRPAGGMQVLRRRRALLGRHCGRDAEPACLQRWTRLALPPSLPDLDLPACPACPALPVIPACHCPASAEWEWEGVGGAPAASAVPRTPPALHLTGCAPPSPRRWHRSTRRTVTFVTGLAAWCPTDCWSSLSRPFCCSILPIPGRFSSSPSWEAKQPTLQTLARQKARPPHTRAHTHTQLDASLTTDSLSHPINAPAVTRLAIK